MPPTFTTIRVFSPKPNHRPNSNANPNQNPNHNPISNPNYNRNLCDDTATPKYNCQLCYVSELKGANFDWLNLENSSTG